MSKQSLLLVDGDARSLRVLEVSLRKAGFTVTTAFNGPDALDKLTIATPDLIISETKLDDMDGFALCKRIKANPAWGEIPFVFLTANTGIEHKVKGLELGVDDYLTKPIYIKEVVTRLQILLQKRQRSRIEERQDGRTRFVGRLSDMAVVDLIQTIEISRKSGVIQFTGEGGRQAAIYFRDGKVVDAEAGPLQGEDAVYRLLTWNEGSFEVVFRTVRRRDVITTPSQGLLMEGMRRLDEWTRLCEQLPPLDTRFEVDTRELAQRLGDIPDENNSILKLMDGRRTLHEVIDAGSVGDLECLQAVSRLFFEGLLVEHPDGRGAAPRAPAGGEESAQWVVPPTVFDETPAEAERIVVGAARDSGPVALARVIPVRARESSGPRTLPPPPPPGRRAAGSNPIPIVRDEPAPAAARVTESGRIAAPPAAAAEPPAAPPEPAPESALDEPRIRTPSGSHEVSPLHGTYRPSSLRKIDEAVAAAQLIAPELFTDDVPALPPLSSPSERPAGAPPAAGPEPLPPIADLLPVPSVRLRTPTPATGGGNGSGALVPGEGTAAATTGASGAPVPGEGAAAATPATGASGSDEPALAAAGDAAPGGRRRTPTPAALAAAADFAEEPSYVFEMDLGAVPDEYLDDADPTPPPPLAPPRAGRAETSRMLASHGADQAQVSGELPIRAADWPEKETTARELITIKPRRITREMPAVVPSPELLAEAEAIATAPRTSAELSATPTPVTDAGSATAVERPRPPSGPSRPGTGTSKAMHGRGVGGLPWVLAAVGLALIAGAYTRWFRSSPHAPVATVSDAAFAELDAAVAAQGPADAAPTRLSAGDRVDAAGRPPPDAAAVTAAPADAAVPAPPDYKQLRDQAQAALDDNDPATALELAERSLAKSKSNRTMLIKAEALRRLDKIDDAVAAVDAAIARDPGYAPSYETKGRILWGVRRTDEARAAFAKYLELKPTGSTADRIRALIGP